MKVWRVSVLLGILVMCWGVLSICCSLGEQLSLMLIVLWIVLVNFLGFVVLSMSIGIFGLMYCCVIFMLLVVCGLMIFFVVLYIVWIVVSWFVWVEVLFMMLNFLMNCFLLVEKLKCFWVLRLFYVFMMWVGLWLISLKMKCLRFDVLEMFIDGFEVVSVWVVLCGWYMLVWKNLLSMLFLFVVRMRCWIGRFICFVQNLDRMLLKFFDGIVNDSLVQLLVLVVCSYVQKQYIVWVVMCVRLIELMVLRCWMCLKLRLLVSFFMRFWQLLKMFLIVMLCMFVLLSENICVCWNVFMWFCGESMNMVICFLLWRVCFVVELVLFDVVFRMFSIVLL